MKGKKMTSPDSKIVLNELVDDMPNEAYHSTKNTFSSSQLKLMLEDPELFHATYIAKTEERVSIPAFDIGTYFHTMVLEPHKIEEDCAVYPGIRRGKEWEKFKEENEGKAIITKSEHEQAMRIVEAAKNSPVAMNYINNGKPEVSAFIEVVVDSGDIYCGDKVLGKEGWEKTKHKAKGVNLILKGRADCLGSNYILDLKSTTGNAKSEKSIKDKVNDYYYDLSAAFYLDLFSAVLDKKMETFIWTFASKDIGNCKNWVASRDVIKVGRAKWKKAIVSLAYHTSQNWKFTDTLAVLEPGWGAKEWLEEKEEDML